MTARFVVMGVSGCGKSLIGEMFAKAADLTFVDGDALHPQSNVDKMASGQPLDDDDREPWLDKVGERLATPATVIACSALKRAYRDRITAAAGHPVTFLYLRGKRETLWERVSSRPGHFMPPELLDSQLATLEEPGLDERAAVADIELSPDEIVEIFLSTKELS